MGFLFKHQKNKRYSYKPRFYEPNESWHEPETRSRLETFRNKISEKRAKLNKASSGLKKRRQAEINSIRRIFFLFALLVILVLYFLDFDFSIFRFAN